MPMCNALQAICSRQFLEIGQQSATPSAAESTATAHAFEWSGLVSPATLIPLIFVAVLMFWVLVSEILGRHAKRQADVTDSDVFFKRVQNWHIVFIALTMLNVAVLALSLQSYNAMPTANRDFDSLTISITSLQIVISLAALFGFWTMRRLTEATAKREARAIAEKVAKEAVEAYIYEEEGRKTNLAQQIKASAEPATGLDISERPWANPYENGGDDA